MSTKPYIKRPEWMESMEKSIDNMIKTVIKERLGLTDEDEIPTYTMMSVIEDRFKHETVFNVRVNTSPSVSHITINMV